MTIKTITTDALQEAIQTGTEAYIIDVREKDEYDGGHIPDAKNIPLSTLENQIDAFNEEDEYMIICQKGGRSLKASELLHENNINVTNVDGGMEAWLGEIEA